MAGQEMTMENTNPAAASGTADMTEVLLARIIDDYNRNGEKSVLFLYKKENITSGDYKELETLFDSAMQATSADQPQKVREYLEFVMKLLSPASDQSGSDYIPSGKDSEGKDKSVLADFREGWRGWLSAFDVEIFTNGEKNAATKTKVSQAFQAVSFPEDASLVLDDERKQVLKIIQERMINSSIKKALIDDIKNMKKGRTISRELLNLCEKAGFISIGSLHEKNVDREDIRERYVRVLKDIYAITDVQKRMQYESAFIPVYIDCVSGVSMAIVGKHSYKQHYETRKYITQEKVNEYDFCPFPCVLTVLHFTDTSLIPKWSASSYEVEVSMTEHMAACGLLPRNGEKSREEIYSEYVNKTEEEQMKILNAYYDMAYNDYKKACKSAITLLAEDKDNWKEDTLDSIKELDFYNRINNTLAMKKAEELRPEAQKQNLANQKQYDFVRKNLKKK